MSDSCMVECRICVSNFKIWEMTQLLPCLHMFCNGCIEKHKRNSKICPVLHCYSSLKSNPEFKWNACENDLCLKRYWTPLDLTKLPICEHWICSECYDAMMQQKTPTCPVRNCDTGVPGVEPRDNAQAPKPAQKAHPTLPRCNANDACEQDALPNFPSEHDCEHEVCLQCLDDMIVDCERTDFLPHCPNAQCVRPYSYDSVAALRALLPERAKYFSGLALDKNQGYDAMRDDTITSLDTATDTTTPQRLVEVKCSVDDDGHTANVLYTSSGSLGGFIRELRRALKIVPTDKVYGYYMRRENHDEDVPDEELVFTSAAAQKPISELQIKNGVSIIVDTTGIVMQKSKGRAANK
ncbi:Protein C15F1.5 a [Aphelenchoides avenae]|nr:Protein C15F1.5 a [Aphelenchus avenae]